jgi:hypothetical protein
MTDLRLLDGATAIARLRETGDAARGFLGLDPVTQNDPLLAKQLSRMSAQLGQAGETVVGWVQNADQPRQAMLATTSADAGAVRAMVQFLAKYQRCTSYVAMVPAGADAEKAFTGSGFREIGVLPEHRYAGGAYHDVRVYFGRTEDTCPA